MLKSLALLVREHLCYEKREEVSAPIVVAVQKLLAKMMELAGVSLLRAWRKVPVAQAGAEGYVPVVVLAAEV